MLGTVGTLRQKIQNIDVGSVELVELKYIRHGTEAQLTAHLAVLQESDQQQSGSDSYIKHIYGEFDSIEQFVCILYCFLVLCQLFIALRNRVVHAVVLLHLQLSLVQSYCSLVSLCHLEDVSKLAVQQLVVKFVVARVPDVPYGF